MAKQKLKTRKSVAKRIRITGSGKILHVKGNRSHKRSIKSARTRRLLRDLHEYSAGFGRNVRALAPYKKRLMFWGDIALNHPDLLTELPRDLIVMSWVYNPRDNFDRYLKPFRDAKLDVMVCPAM